MASSLAAAVCAALFASGPATAPRQEAWSPELQLGYPTVMATAVSSSGEHVAWVARELEPARTGGRSAFRHRLWIRPVDREIDPIEVPVPDARDPAFSPDGRLLAFLSSASGRTQVWIGPATGGTPWQLTDAPRGVRRFRWSPTGDRIAHTAPDPPRDSVWRELAATPPDHLYVVPVGTGIVPSEEVGRVTWGDFHVAGFDWSPDGNRIVATRRPTASADGAFGDSDLMVLLLGGRSLKRVRPLSAMPGTETGPLWSPDGRWIAFAGSGDRPEPIGLGDLYVIPAEGGEPRRLASTPERSGARPLAWTADSRAILVAEPDSGSTRLFAVPVDGGEPAAATDGSGFRSVWSAPARASRVAFAYEDAETPPDVYVAEATTSPSMPGVGLSHRVSDLARGLPRPPMGRTGAVSWASADGTRIEGLVTLPPGARGPREAPGQKAYPLLTILHGGPTAAWSDRFTGGPDIHMIQSLVARGIAVLRPNPRGSVGYGPSFRHAVAGEPGIGDLDDVLSGVDHLVDLGIAHPDSLAIAGWGYGAFLAALATSRTDRFKVSSLGEVLADLDVLGRTTDIPSYLEAFAGEGTAGAPGARVESRRPIHAVERIETPTQLLHAVGNLRIPHSQSRLLHEALAARGVRTELLLLEERSFQDDPVSLADGARKIIGWIESGLRPEVAPPPIDRGPVLPRRARVDPAEYLPYGEPGSATILGRAYLILEDGSTEPCAHGTVFMNPVTTYSTEWYERNVIGREELEPAPLDLLWPYHWFVRAGADGGFRFFDLPPGDYYLGCRVRENEGFVHGRVSVDSGGTAEVQLTRRAGS